jgi:hypothetical protein
VLKRQSAFYKPLSRRKMNVLQQKHDKNNLKTDCHYPAVASDNVDHPPTIEDQITNTPDPISNVCTNETQAEDEVINKKIFVDHVNYLQEKTKYVAKEKKKLKSDIAQLRQKKSQTPSA